MWKRTARSEGVGHRMISEVTSCRRKYIALRLAQAGEQWKCVLDGRELPVDVVYGQNGVLFTFAGRQIV